MHYTAQQNAIRFFKTYVSKKQEAITIIEMGSQIGGFNIRSLAPDNATYIGIDIDKYPGVDIMLDDPYIFPLEDNSVDFVISSSCFEHIEFFWLSYLEAMRILKPTGLFYLNAPSTGAYHTFPIDAWRFYPDSAKSLVSWGIRNGIVNNGLLEQYTSNKDHDIWADYVAVFAKDISQTNCYPDRIIDTFNNYTNGSKYPHDRLQNINKW